jgi:tetratricopeptide (TPR) repeat protein
MRPICVSIAAGLTMMLLALAAGSAQADQNDPRLPALFEALKSAPSPAEAQPIEWRIWTIWLESGDAAIDALMHEGNNALAQRDFELALTAFNHVVAHMPYFAEGWNKRATLLWLMDRNTDSLLDVERTLALEPRHFGALSGRGMIEIEEGNPRAALTALEAALALHPQMESVRAMVRDLRAKLHGRPT